MTAKKNYPKRVPGQDDIVSFEYVTPNVSSGSETPHRVKRVREDRDTAFAYASRIPVACQILLITNGVINSRKAVSYNTWHYQIKPPLSHNWITLFSSSSEENIVDWAKERRLPTIINRVTMFIDGSV